MSLDQISAFLDSKRTEDRVRGAEKLSARDDSHAPLLLKLLEDRTPYVAAIAARKLSEFPPERVERALLKAYLERDEKGVKLDPGCHIRTYLALALGKLGYHPAADAIRRGIRTVQTEQGTDTAVSLRGNCALALSQLAPPDAVRDIAILLFEPGGFSVNSSQARKAAAQALGRVPDAAAIVPLAVRLSYPGEELPEVLAVCMESVVALEDPRAVELLEPFLVHSDQHLAAHAALMIAQTGHEDAPGLLRSACDRLRGDPLRAVVLGLSALRTDAAHETLLALAGSILEEVRLAVIEALAGARDTKSLATLQIVANEDSSPSVRRAAALALKG